MTNHVSRLAGQLTRSRDELVRALEFVGRLQRCDLALQHAYERAYDTVPPLHRWEMDPDDEEAKKAPPPPRIPNPNRDEEIRTTLQARRDREMLIDLGKTLDRLTRNLRQAIDRQVELIEEAENRDDGCGSCARFDYFDDVDPRCLARGLCRWCRDFENAYGQLPPKEALRLRHEESPRAAGLWIARNPGLRAAAARIEAERLNAVLSGKDSLEDVAPACGCTFTHLGQDYACIRAQNHSGECAAVSPDGTRITWTRYAVTS